VTAPDDGLKSELLLDEIKRRDRMGDVVDAEDELVKVVIFTSGDAGYAFYGADIKEILPACVISWVPGLPEYLPGLINVRGDIESVIDIRHFLGFERIDPEKCLVIMAVRGDFRSGILVDSIEDVMDIPKSAIKPPLTTLGGVARGLVAGEIEHARGVITLLDVEKLAAGLNL
jgi:purine-binding chemotaxis protein CheW